MNLGSLKNWKVWVFGGLILVAAIAAYTWISQAQTASKSPYQTQAVTRGTLTVRVEATGTLRAAQSAFLVWNTGGRIESVQASMGKQVRADQMLANLASDSLSRNIILAQAELITAQQELDSLQQSNSQQAEAMQTLADAKQTVSDVRDRLDMYERSSQARVSEELLVDYRDQIERAEDQLKRMTYIYNTFFGYDNMAEGRAAKAEITVNLTNIKQNIASLKSQYNWFVSKPSEILLEQTRDGSS